MIELRHVTKDYAVGLRGLKLRALDDLTLSVPRGTIYGLLGPNGSGKSTAIKLILGLIEPSRGACTVNGVPSRRVAARAAVGYMPESPNFYRHLTGRELVTFYARICGLSGPELPARVNEVIGWVGMSGAAGRRVGDYSKGMLQRIGLAQAIVHDPALVILDEPTAGVDPLGAEAMAQLILQLKAQGKTVLITSHLLAQMDAICDRVALLERGRLIFEGAVNELAPGPVREGLWLDEFSPAEQTELKSWLAARGRRPTTVEPAGGRRLDRIFIGHMRSREVGVIPAGG